MTPPRTPPSPARPPATPAPGPPTVLVMGVRAVLLTGSLALLVTGCAGPEGSTAGPVAVTSPAPVTAASGSYNGTDLAWIQLMIPMNEQLLPVLALAGERSSDQAVRELMARIRDGHREELAALRDLFARTGLPDSKPHAGHDMPGLVSEAKLASLAGSTGPAFEQRWRELLREHLDQCASLARSEQKSGVDTATKELARRIEQSATTHRQALDQIA